MTWEVYKQLCCWTNVWYLGGLGCVYRNTRAVVKKQSPQNNHTSFLLQKTFHSLVQSCIVKGSNMCGLFPLWSRATSCRTCIMHWKSKLRRRNWQWDTADCRLSMGWHCPPLERAEFDWRGVEVSEIGRVQLKRDGTRWRTGGEVKGKLANGVGNQHPSHYFETWRIQHYCRWCAHLDCQ